VNAAGVIKLARLRAGLSKRELARRAGTSPAAIVHYESGAQAPTLPTLERVVSAAGTRIVVELDRSPIDRHVADERVQQVLRFADHFPRKPAARRLPYPPLPQ